LTVLLGGLHSGVIGKEAANEGAPMPSTNSDYDEIDACTCVEFCDQDPATACSLSGQPHVHPEIPGHPGVYGPCPVHPDRPGDH
jgi:hypothetical protein